MNIFYAVIIIDMDAEKESIEEEAILFSTHASQAITEVYSDTGHRDRNISELTNEADSSRVESEYSSGRKDKIESYLKFRDVFNSLTICGSIAVLCVDYEGQSQQFEFIIDCLDVGMFCCSVCSVIVNICLECKFQEKMEKVTIFDILVILICSVGMVYEAAVADSFYTFLSAESIGVEILRSVKCWRIFTIIIRKKEIFCGTYSMMWKILQAIEKVKFIMLMWFAAILILAIMNYHLQSGRVLLNSQGQLDLDNGSPNQFCFSDVYHSLIFTLLSVYNEEWDLLMFKEYRGFNPIAVCCLLVTMFFGYIIFTKYFIGSLTRELDVDLCQDDQEESDEVESSVESESNANRIMPLGRVQSEDQETSCECLVKVKVCLKNIIESKVVLVLKIVFISLNCIGVTSITPNTSPSSSELSLVNGIFAACFAFFLAETLANVLVYGLRGENSYVRREPINALNLVLLVIEFLCFTPLSVNSIFARVAKAKVLRCCFLIHLRYKHNWWMKIIFQSFFKTFPLILSANVLMVLFFFFFCLFLTKAFKNDVYYCDNAADFAIVTKEDCFNWGGDWVKENINMSSVLSSQYYGILSVTMEGWIYIVIDLMNVNGAGKAPSYNANEHIQIYFVGVFFLGGILGLNIYISILLVGFRKAKERLSGEASLNELQKQWLKVKALILQMDPEPKRNPPENCFRRVFFRMCSHKCCKIIQGITFVVFLVIGSFYSPRLSDEQ